MPNEVINAGTVAVDIIPSKRSVSTFWSQFVAQTSPGAGRAGSQLGQAIQAGIRKGIVDGVRAGLAEGARLASAQGRQAGQSYGTEFGTAARRRIDTLLRDLPSPTVGVDVDTAAARAQLATVGAEARAVGSLDPTVQVHADTAGATAGLAAVGAAADGAGGSMSGLIAVAAGLAPAIVPAAAASAAALAGIGLAAVSGVAAMGVARLGVSGVGDAVKALTTAHAGGAAAASNYAARQSQIATAADQVRSAEESLAVAQQAATQAQAGLTVARQQAVQALQDLNNQVVDGSLAERRARLDVADAERELTAARNASAAAAQAVVAAQQALAAAQGTGDPKKIAGATQALTAAQQRQAQAQRDLARAQLNRDQAVQQLREQVLQNQRLAQQEKAAAKAGVEGSAQVVAAKQRITDANRGVLDAERRVESAQRSLRQAYAATSAAGASGVDQVAQAMANLSPAGQKFALFLASLKPKLDALRATAQGGLLPGVEAGIRSLLPLLPLADRLVGAIASALGGMAAQAGRALGGPWWQQFYVTVGQQIVPTLRTMGTILGNVATGAAGLFQAVLPLGTDFGNMMLSLSARFKNFGATAADNPSFQAFLAYARQSLPLVVGLVGSLATVAGHLAIAMAPIGTSVLQGLKGIADGISTIPADTLRGIATTIGALVVGFKLLAVNSSIGRIVTILGALVTGAGAASGALGPFIKTLSSTLGPVIKTVGQALQQGLVAIMPAVNQLFKALAPVLGVIVKALAGALVPIIKSLAKVLAAVLPALVPIIRIIGGGLAKVITLVAPYIGQLAQLLGRELTAGLRILAPILGVLIRGLLQIVQAIMPLVGAVLQLAMQLFPVMLPLWQQLGQVLVMLLPPVLQLVSTLVTSLLPVFKALMPVIVLLVGLLVGQLSRVLQMVVVPLLTYVLVPALRLVATVISWLVRTVLVPLINVWASKFTWVINTIIKPILNGAAAFFRKVVGPAFVWLKDRVVGSFNTMRAGLSAAWGFIRDRIFHPISSFVTSTIPNAFGRGIGLIRQQWDKLRSIAKAPISFMIHTVLNQGLIGAYNWIAKKFSLSTIKPIAIKGFSSGGYTGPGHKMQPAGVVHAGEWVLTKDQVKKIGVGNLNAAFGGGKLPRQPGDGSQGIALPGYADGGLVGWLKGAWRDITNPGRVIKDKALGLLHDIPGAPMMANLVTGAVKSSVGKVSAAIGDMLSIGSGDGSYGGPITKSIRSVWQFIKAQGGKPYIWASAGPRGYDCSGLVSAVYNYAHGRNPYRHTFSTMNEAPYFPKPGHGLFTAGWANRGERGGGSVGHTAGNYAGLAFESGGALGNTHYGHGSTPVDSFRHVGTYDSGGYLPPGLSAVFNGTGRPEPVFTSEQFAAMRKGGAQGDGGRVFNFYGKQGFTYEEIQQKEYAKSLISREGRPR